MCIFCASYIHQYIQIFSKNFKNYTLYGGPYKLKIIYILLSILEQSPCIFLGILDKFLY